MIPFMTEDIYQNLVSSIDQAAPESIHLCDFPSCKGRVDRQRSWRRTWTRFWKIVVMGRACRNAANIKNRQPIGQMFIKADVRAV